MEIEEEKNQENYNTLLYVGFGIFGGLIFGMSCYSLSRINKAKAPSIVNIGWSVFLNIGACIMTAAIYMFICTGYRMGCVYNQDGGLYCWVFLAISIVLVVLGDMILNEHMNGHPSDYETRDSKNLEIIATILAIGCTMVILCIAGIAKTINDIHSGSLKQIRYVR